MLHLKFSLLHKNTQRKISSALFFEIGIIVFFLVVVWYSFKLFNQVSNPNRDIGADMSEPDIIIPEKRIQSVDDYFSKRDALSKQADQVNLVDPVY